jgi:hypothetical protein
VQRARNRLHDHNRRFTLNSDERVHTGDGGSFVTDEPDLTLYTKVIRNLSEAVVDDAGAATVSRTLTYKFWFRKIGAVNDGCQLRRLSSPTACRTRLAPRRAIAVVRCAGLQTPVLCRGNEHVGYTCGLRVDPGAVGRRRIWLYASFTAVDVQWLARNCTKIHRLLLDTARQAFGHRGSFWTLRPGSRPIEYGLGTCIGAEDAQDGTVLGVETCSIERTDQNKDRIVTAFRKVWSHAGARL